MTGSLDPDMATYMLSVLAKMRWLESPVLPMAHVRRLPLTLTVG